MASGYDLDIQVIQPMFELKNIVYKGMRVLFCLLSLLRSSDFGKREIEKMDYIIILKLNVFALIQIEKAVYFKKNFKKQI